ncbi:MAG: homoserine dehydrogenase [Anderseniella sp.]
MTNALRVGIAGLGTVGVGVLDVFAKHPDMLAARAGRPIQVTAVSARSRSKQRGGHDLSEFEWFDNPVELATSSNVDVFVELIGGDSGPAHDGVEAALKAGKHVVTANKALLAHHGVKLAKLAEAANVSLNYEAAVAGAIPVIKTLRESLAGNSISHLFGILNGTCNFILTTMEAEGRDFADVLKQAQDLGYAEADPTFDIGGFDTAHKLAILTSLAFGTEVTLDGMYIEGIEDITLADIRNAHSLGYKFKLLGVANLTEDGIEQRVHPALVPLGSPIAEVGDAFNAVELVGDFADKLFLEGRGAGGGPTASSVMADICDIGRGLVLPVFGVPASNLKPFAKASMRAHEGGYYVALDMLDRPGELAGVAKAFADENISIESVIQRGPAVSRSKVGADIAPFVLITHNTLESAMRVALDKIETAGHVATRPRMVRIERL